MYNTKDFLFLDVRLVSLYNVSYAGRIEVFFNNEWGQWCHNIYREDALNVVCSQIGYASMNSPSLFLGFTLPENSRVWINDINCIGNESTLLECPSDVEFHVGKIRQPCNMATGVECPCK